MKQIFYSLAGIRLEHRPRAAHSASPMLQLAFFSLTLLSASCSLFSAPRNASLLISVDQSERTITVDLGFKPRITVDNEAPHNQKTYKVGEMTTISLNGLKGEFANLKSGMRVIVTVGISGDTAAAITAYETPPKEKKPAKAWNDRQPFSKIGMDRIISIREGIITITSAKRERARSYIIADVTQITVNGEKEMQTALRPGMKVSLTISHNPNVAAAIAASD